MSFVDVTLTGYHLMLSQHLELHKHVQHNCLRMDMDRFQDFITYGNIRQLHEEAYDKNPNYERDNIIHPPQSYEGIINNDDRLLYVLHHGFVLSKIHICEDDIIITWDIQEIKGDNRRLHFPEFDDWLCENAATLFTAK